MFVGRICQEETICRYGREKIPCGAFGSVQYAGGLDEEEVVVQEILTLMNWYYWSVVILSPIALLLWSTVVVRTVGNGLVLVLWLFR